MAAVTESTTEELDIHLFFPLYVSFAGTFNYMIAYLVGLTAAASVGAWTTMASVVLVGASMLWIPVVLLHLSLNLLGLNSTWFSVLLDYVFYFGAIATGAAFFGLAVEPFIMCALITPSIALFINIACFLFLDVPGYFFSSTVRYEHSSEQEISDSALEGVLERMLRRGPAAVNTTGDTRRPLQRPVRVLSSAAEEEETSSEDEAMLRRGPAAVNTTGDTRRPLQRPVRVPVEEVDSSEEEEDEAMLYTNRPNHFFTQAAQPLEQINASSDAVISPT